MASDYVERHELLPSDEIKRRLAEKAALVAELEARTPRLTPTSGQAPVAQPASALTTRLTANGQTLAKLVNAATRADRRAMKSAEIANEDRIAANDARQALDAYMRENGLA